MTPESVAVAAARAYCRAQFNYDGPYMEPDGADKHLESDAQSTATEDAFRAAVDAAYAAGRRHAATLESIVREAACVTGETVTDWQQGYADCSARVLATVDSWARIAEAASAARLAARAALQERTGGGDMTEPRAECGEFDASDVDLVAEALYRNRHDYPTVATPWREIVFGEPHIAAEYRGRARAVLSALTAAGRLAAKAALSTPPDTEETTA